MERRFRINSTELSIKESVVTKLSQYIQYNKHSLESGGLLMGRTNIEGNTEIFDLTEPMVGDIQNRFFFKRRDKGHIQILTQLNQKCLYFKGNWHTHPQLVPNPSIIDIRAWKKAMKESKPGESNYIFFIIVGIESISVWCGDIRKRNIIKMKEES